jgi:ADP-dependent NAD(P)H-hydrate dehydratase / NAD(P)H-hydrate epimerase
MLLAKTDQIRAIEEEAVREQGLDLGELMERAGTAVAEEAAAMLAPGGRVVVFCGGGNNGGDGFVAARRLARKNYAVEVVMLAEPAELTGPAAAAFQSIAATGTIAKTSFDAGQTVPPADLLIDAVLGFGLRGALRGPAAEAVDAINSSGTPVLSVDIPSGVDSDTGAVHGPAVRATTTVTFTLPKVGMALYPGLDYVGRLRVADIGIDKKIVSRYAKTCLGSRAVVRRLLPTRTVEAHKGQCGRVLVIAGSVGMTGAAALSAAAALRSGAGLVTLATARSLNDILETKLTEVMTKPLPETPERTIAPQAIETVLEAASDFDAVLLGPGLSTNRDTAIFIRELVARLSAPLVIDADGLTALAKRTDILLTRQAPTILTPHPGELARLLNATAAEIQKDRLSVAQEAARLCNAAVILKGARTIVAEGDCAYINPTGNPGLATAGTGDVLAGVLAGLIAQGLPLYPAAMLAAYLHGAAGDLAAADKTQLALVAADLLDYLPTAIKELE